MTIILQLLSVMETEAVVALPNVAPVMLSKRTSNVSKPSLISSATVPTVTVATVSSGGIIMKVLVDIKKS